MFQVTALLLLNLKFCNVGGVEVTGIEQARKDLGGIVDRARLKGEATMITRKGRLAAVVVPVDWYERAALRGESDGADRTGGAQEAMGDEPARR